MNKKIRNLLQYMIFMGGGLFLVWWQFRDFKAHEKEEFMRAIYHVNYWFTIPVACMSILSHISRSMRWKLMMEPLGFKPSLSNTFGVTMVGYLANSAVPRLGELLKCTMLAKYENLKTDKLIGTIILERSFDLVCYIVFILITFFIQMDTIGHYMEHELNLFSYSNGINLLFKIGLILGICLSIWLTIRFLLKKYPQSNVIKSVTTSISGVIEGIKSIRSLSSIRLFLMHTVVIWVLYLAQIYVGFKAMEGTHTLGIHEACSVLSLATLAMIITPGGLGSFPFFVMQTLLLYNIESVQGKAFGWIMWGATTSIVIIFGFLSLILLPYFNREKRGTMI